MIVSAMERSSRTPSAPRVSRNTAERWIGRPVFFNALQPQLVDQMAGDHVVVLESEPNPADMQALVKGLVAFNTEQLGGEVQQYLIATVRDAARSLVGGLFGVTYMHWLHVQAVWLHADARGRGHGRALMDLAEDEARRRGCHQAFLETFSFQALPFYEKCGYTIFSTLRDMPPGGARYALTKVLSPTTAPPPMP